MSLFITRATTKVSGYLSKSKPVTARTKTHLVLCLASVLAFPAISSGQTVFSTGLENPSKVIYIGDGNLLVAETGESPNSGRISLISSAGGRRTIIDGLPSGLAAPDFEPDGPTGIELHNQALYITIGEGDTHVNGPRAGTIIPNPNGPSSPIFSTVLRIRFSEPVSQLLAEFTLSLPNQFTLADAKSVDLDNGSGQHSTIQLVGAFRVDRPDPVNIYRNTHLYGLAFSCLFPDDIYIDDAGNNTIWRLDLDASVPSLLTRFPNLPNPPGTVPASGEAAPSSVRSYDDHLLVSEFSGAPFLAGNSVVASVNLRTGAVTPVVKGLSFAIDALELRGDFHSGILILEYSTDLLTGAPGELLFSDGRNTKLLATGLVTPSSMAFDPKSNLVFVANRSGGQILQISIHP